MKTSWALHSSVSELKQKRSSFRLKTWARVKIGDLDPKAQRSNKLAKLENATTYRKSRNWSRKMRVCNPSCLRVASFPELKWNNHELNPQLKSAKVPREVEQVQCVSFTIIVECNDWLIGSLQSPSRSLCNRKRAFIRYSTRRWHPIFLCYSYELLMTAYKTVDSGCWDDLLPSLSCTNRSKKSAANS